MVQIKFRCRINRQRLNKHICQEKQDIDQFKNPEVRKKYEDEINNKLEEIDNRGNEPEIENHWINIKYVTQSAEMMDHNTFQHQLVIKK